MNSTNSDQETTCLTIIWSKQADTALRTYLGSHGMQEGDISKFVEEAVRWRIFHDNVQEARDAFADVIPDELQTLIDASVEDVRATRYRRNTQQP